jgi:hypothetical protein
VVTFAAIYVTGIAYLGRTTPISFDARLFLPLLPTALLFLGGAISAAEREHATTPARWPRSWRAAVAAAALFYVASNAAATLAAPAHPFPLTRVRRALAAPGDDGASLRAWIDGHLDPSAPIAAVDGQATGFELHRPTLSLIDAEYSDQRWSEEHLRAVMDHYGSTHLVVYPGDRSPRSAVQRESACLREIVAGRPPAWLTRVASNGRAAVYRVVSR